MAAATPIRLDLDDLDANLAVLKSEINEGHAVDLVRGDAVVAEVRSKLGLTTVSGERPPIPDFEARWKELWGDHVFPEGYMTRIVREDRDGRG